MGDNSRYIGAYVIPVCETIDVIDEWKEKYAYGRDDKLGLKHLCCLAYGSIPVFIPKDSTTFGTFEEYFHDIGGGTMALNVSEKKIRVEISMLRFEAKEDLKKLEEIMGPLDVEWGMLTQYG